MLLLPVRSSGKQANKHEQTQIVGHLPPQLLSDQSPPVSYHLADLATMAS